ncbi:MAG: tyrosine-type recombinase/integrase [Oscillospiraceae bacterium]|nr:tyrosine-type recombinase/integrase [Oscillospiraceae bacterium]
MLNQNKNVGISSLPSGLERLLNDYREHCVHDGIKGSSIALYLKEDIWFLQNLYSVGCGGAEQINDVRVAAACLALKSNSYLSTIKTFLRFLADAGYTAHDYSYVVPPYKRPQPIPSVYSTAEICSVEAAAHDFSKRDYAVLLLATRLGIRSGDIAVLSFDTVDFNADVIRLVQQKTNAAIELPLLPEIKSALKDYIRNERPKCDSPHIFLNQEPPHNHISIMLIGKIVRRNLIKAGVEIGGRSQGPHAFRSSLASSMVNDSVPYEIVRKTLGHIDKNAIKSYARLNVEQLRPYALDIPEASAGFADFLAGKAVL